MLLAQYFTEFMIFSFLGWVWETIYCTACTKHWQNRGFLFGPVCPIYGTGAVAVLMLHDLIPAVSKETMPIWQLFLIFMVGSAILEYLTSWILETLFHARWWDYSQMPLNLNGRICLPASILFGIFGVLILRYLVPLFANVHHMTYPLLTEGLAIGWSCLLGADLSLSIASMSHLLKTMELAETQLNETMEQRVQAMLQLPEYVGKKTDELKEMLKYEPGLLSKQYRLSFREKRHLRNVRFISGDKYENMASRFKQMMKDNTHEEKHG